MLLRPRQILAPVIFATLFGYFGYHLVNGDRGLLAMARLEREVQIAGVRVLLHRLDERIDGLVVLLVQQQIQAFEVRFRRVMLLALQLPNIEARCHPAQSEGDGQTEQQPLQVKVHRAADVQAEAGSSGSDAATWRPLRERSCGWRRGGASTSSAPSH